MKELLRTTDPVFLSWLQAVLLAEGIEPITLDFHTSALTSAIPRRVMVEDKSHSRARQIMIDIGEGERLAAP